MEMENVQKFSGRAENYTAGIPAYPLQLIAYLHQNYINETYKIANIGCETGKFTKQLLEKGNVVYGVEPNADMRQTAIAELSCFENFTAIDGTASNTNLPPKSVDFNAKLYSCIYR